MGKAAAPCVRADGPHGEADDDFADVRRLRIAQGGMLDRRESTGCMKSCAENYSTANQQDLSALQLYFCS